MYTSLDRKKGRPREYTHTHMGIHEDTDDLKKGEEEIHNSIGIGSFFNETGCCLSKHKMNKNGLRNILTDRLQQVRKI